jgi:hypothetical protein
MTSNRAFGVPAGSAVRVGLMPEQAFLRLQQGCRAGKRFDARRFSGRLGFDALKRRSASLF